MNLASSYPELTLADMAGGTETLILCPTARLAGAVRQAHGEIQMRRGLSTWQPLNGATIAQWLDHLCSAALLRGEIPAAAVPGHFLTRPQERCLWERALAEDAAMDVTADASSATELLDREGLAQAAMEAQQLAHVWRINVPDAWQSEEYRAFLRWRERLASFTQTNNWTTAAAALDWRIACLARGLSGLPKRVGLSGFVSADPVLDQLLKILDDRGVEIVRVVLAAEPAGNVANSPSQNVFQQPCADAETECRAAAQWARDHLRTNPQARLRIAVADWTQRRPQLEAALDEALHPDAIGANWALPEKQWAAINGVALADQYLVTTALRLLQLAVRPDAVVFSDLGELLCGGGWSADLTEADARAQCEVALRDRVAPETTLDIVRRATATDFSAALPHLCRHLETLAICLRHQPARQLPGVWGQGFVEVLDALAWPGERQLLPLEHVACDTLREMLAGLRTLDNIVGRVDAASALRLVRQLLRDQTIRPPRHTRPAVEIGALDDALATPADGLWLMGMNEGAWPPGARPNPMLPASRQRAAGVPAACPERLAAQAQALQSLWCSQAHEVVFSWAQREGERALRASPLIAGLPERSPDSAMDAGQLSNSDQVLDQGLDQLHDALAPPMDAAERQRVRGGTALLQAQAVCPAWGFYHYRLGAAALPVPIVGLDPRVRGGLLHAALEAFWQGRGLVDLVAMSPAMRDAEIARAVDLALCEHADKPPKQQTGALPPRLAALERRRLCAVLASWLDVEAQRADFTVLACEAHHDLTVAGLPVHVIVDRVDQLGDGRLVVLDYKSGRSASAESWADARLVEPQLPIYAALAFPDRDVAAIALARVISDEPGFVGVAEDAALLPGVKALAEQERRYTAADFPDWPSLRQRWAERIELLADEIVSGIAAVVVDDDKQLAYCPVKPLLRLAERRTLFDQEGV